MLSLKQKTNKILSGAKIKSSFVYSRKQSYVPSYYNLWFPVDVQINNHV